MKVYDLKQEINFLKTFKIIPRLKQAKKDFVRIRFYYDYRKEQQ